MACISPKSSIVRAFFRAKCSIVRAFFRAGTKYRPGAKFIVLGGLGLKLDSRYSETPRLHHIATLESALHIRAHISTQLGYIYAICPVKSTCEMCCGSSIIINAHISSGSSSKSSTTTLDACKSGPTCDTPLECARKRSIKNMKAWSFDTLATGSALVCPNVVPQNSERFVVLSQDFFRDWVVGVGVRVRV